MYLLSRENTLFEKKKFQKMMLALLIFGSWDHGSRLFPVFSTISNEHQILI